MKFKKKKDTNLPISACVCIHTPKDTLVLLVVLGYFNFVLWPGFSSRINIFPSLNQNIKLHALINSEISNKYPLVFTVKVVLLKKQKLLLINEEISSI